jgi:glycosyltransferase involved in cell wall biosynthesis
MPTYNRPEGLRRSLAYVIGQNYQNLEIIVSDNATPGESIIEIIREFMAKDARIRFFRQPINRGAAFNFQFVLQQATGDFFMWAADDDEWLPDFIETCLGYFEDDTILVCPKMEILWRVTGKTEPITFPPLHVGMSAYERLRLFTECPSPSMVYGLYRRRELLRIFDGKKTFDFYDCALIMRILAKSPVKIVSEILYRAGIDTPEYNVKPHRDQIKSKLIYFPFLKYSFKTVWSCSMKLHQKVVLCLLIVKFVIQQYLHHEKDYAIRSRSGLFKYKIADITYGILRNVIK